MLDFIIADGNRVKHVAATYGGEYAGPCPWCGGIDRFRVWPERDRFWCRQCGRSGDSIQYLRTLRGMSYKEACNAVGVRPKAKGRGCGEFIPPKWAPRTTKEPTKTWRMKAGAFLEWTQKQLLANAGAEIVSWLHGVRGLTDQTIIKSGLGWNPKDFWREREDWGLEESLSEEGRPKRLWLPKGLVIPYVTDDHVIRLRVRRPEPEDGPRYYLVPGSDTRAMILGGKSDFAMVLESELDASLVSQEVGDLVTVIALGNASSRPDKDAHNFLRGVRRILVALDTDDAGAKEAWRWWPQRYPNVTRWPGVGGKDPGEMFQSGVDIGTWIETGLESL
jgi:DNA primase